MSSKRINQNFHIKILERSQEVANPGYPVSSPDPGLSKMFPSPIVSSKMAVQIH